MPAYKITSSHVNRYKRTVFWIYKAFDLIYRYNFERLNCFLFLPRPSRKNPFWSVEISFIRLRARMSLSLIFLSYSGRGQNRNVWDTSYNVNMYRECNLLCVFFFLILKVLFIIAWNWKALNIVIFMSYNTWIFFHSIHKLEIIM